MLTRIGEAEYKNYYIEERFHGRQTSESLVVVVQKERRSLPVDRPD
jgi:hypothetical protein